MAYKITVNLGHRTRVQFRDSQTAAMSLVKDWRSKHNAMVSVTFRNVRPFFFGQFESNALAM